MYEYVIAEWARSPGAAWIKALLLLATAALLFGAIIAYARLLMEYRRTARQEQDCIDVRSLERYRRDTDEDRAA